MQSWLVIMEITICNKQNLIGGESNDKKQAFN